MDSFMICAKQMLKEFQRLLNSHPVPLSFRCFLQIMCINVYTISEASKKSEYCRSSQNLSFRWSFLFPANTQSSAARSDILDASLSISFSMFELMCRKFVDLSDFTSLKPYSDILLSIPDDADIILPSIKVQKLSLPKIGSSQLSFCVDMDRLDDFQWQIMESSAQFGSIQCLVRKLFCRERGK